MSSALLRMAYYIERIRVRAAMWWYDQIPQRLAGWLPRNVALYAFIRVHKEHGHITPEFSHAMWSWLQKNKKRRTDKGLVV